MSGPVFPGPPKHSARRRTAPSAFARQRIPGFSRHGARRILFSSARPPEMHVSPKRRVAPARILPAHACPPPKRPFRACVRTALCLAPFRAEIAERRHAAARATASACSASLFRKPTLSACSRGTDARGAGKMRYFILTLVFNFTNTALSAFRGDQRGIPGPYVRPYTVIARKADPHEDGTRNVRPYFEKEFHFYFEEEPCLR